MRFAMFKGEKSVADLAIRLFRLQGKGSQAAIKQAADALLKANPQLKDPSSVPAGSLIAIPDAAPPVAPGEEARSAALVRSYAALNVQAAFDALQQRLTGIQGSALDQLKTASERFQAADMKSAVKAVAGGNVAFPGGAPNLDSIAKDAKDMVKTAQTEQDTLKQVGTQLRTVLSSFVK